MYGSIIKQDSGAAGGHIPVSSPDRNISASSGLLLLAQVKTEVKEEEITGAGGASPEKVSSALASIQSCIKQESDEQGNKRKCDDSIDGSPKPAKKAQSENQAAAMPAKAARADATSVEGASNASGVDAAAPDEETTGFRDRQQLGQRVITDLERLRDMYDPDSDQKKMPYNPSEKAKTEICSVLGDAVGKITEYLEAEEIAKLFGKPCTFQDILDAKFGPLEEDESGKYKVMLDIAVAASFASSIWYFDSLGRNVYVDSVRQSDGTIKTSRYRAADDKKQ